MTASIPATCGAPYRVRKTGRLYTLSRINSRGQESRIVMARDDAIAICNTLIDTIEQDKQ